MPVAVTRGDLVKIAGNLGRQGKPAPQWIDDDPAYRAAYDQAAGVTPAAPATAAPATTSTPTSSSSPTSKPTPAKARAKAPTKAPARKPAVTRPAQPATPPAVPGPPADGYLSRSFSPSAAADRLGAGKLTRAGDGGGLLLALVLYPIGLATVKYGADGPGAWFRAKWLNQAQTLPGRGLGQVGAGRGVGRIPKTPRTTRPR